ncbi:hypothetical protein J6590_025232 [Homalodisca vitripennis]|nr:hypothetical protein J6590_025232 [Homalodisca vitripennis]
MRKNAVLVAHLVSAGTEALGVGNPPATHLGMVRLIIYEKERCISRHTLLVRGQRLSVLVTHQPHTAALGAGNPPATPVTTTRPTPGLLTSSPAVDIRLSRRQNNMIM